MLQMLRGRPSHTVMINVVAPTRASAVFTRRSDVDRRVTPKHARPVLPTHARRQLRASDRRFERAVDGVDLVRQAAPVSAVERGDVDDDACLYVKLHDIRGG